jgi:hypothetical protein
MRLIKRHALWNSPDNELRFIASDTAQANCRIDEYIAKNKDISKAKNLKTGHVQKASQHITHLACQGAAFRKIQNIIPKANIGLWSKTVDELHSSKFIFTRKALTQTLPTASNLVRWNRGKDPICHQCTSGVPQTNKHVLSNCSSEAALSRYTKRHNDILRIIVSWIKSSLPNSYKLFADISCSHCLRCATSLLNFAQILQLILEAVLQY